MSRHGMVAKDGPQQSLWAVPESAGMRRRKRRDKVDTTREYPIREGPRQRRVSLNRTKKPAESDMSRQCFGQTPTEERVGSRDSREKPETEKPGASGVRSNRSITALKNLQDISGKHDDCDALSLLIHCDDTGYGDLLEDAEKIKKAFEDFLDGARYEDLKSGRLGDADKTLKVGIVRDYVIPMAPFSQNARKRTVESHQRSGDWEKTLTSRTSDKGHWAHGAKSPELKDNESQEFNATDDKHNENGGINDDHKVDSGGDGEEEENDVELALNGFKGQEVNATDDKLNKSGEMNDDHKVDNGGDSKEREDDDVELALNGFEVYQRLNSPLDRPEVTEQDATVVRKRLAYIVQLRNYEFIALLTTTPDYAMPYLKALLYRYLAFQNGFGIHRASSGLLGGWRPYYMTFQMCFYVLRRTEKPCTDDRFCRLIEDGTRRPIRECRDLDEFEVPDHRPRTDRLRLYQAQHAFVVMFHDKTDQIAYHLVDNSYSRCDPEDKRETAEWYDELMTDGMDPDPCSHGKVDATRLGDPCHFFLTTVTVRLREMTIQWKKTVKDLTLKSAREIDRVRRKVLRRKVRPSKEPLQWDEDARSEKRWNTLKILAETLEDALEELKPRRSDVEHFKSAMDAHGNQALAGYIREINKFRAELDRCVKKLRQQIREEEKLRGDLTERVSLEFQEIARTFSDAQQALQSQIAILGFVMVLLSPVSLTTGIFSVEDKYMPMSRSWRSFILTTVLFWAVILLFWVVSNCFSRVWGKFRGDSECYPSGRKLWRRWLGGGELRKTLDEAVNEV